MDLNKFDTIASSDEGAVMVVTTPGDGSPLLQDNGEPVTITLAGVDSERYRKQERANTNRRLSKGGRRGGVTITAEELEIENLELLVACTLGWSGIVLDGNALDCTPANARAIYKRVPWLREDADSFMAKRANFLKASPKT